MKTIGILGGMSWESTSLYYRRLNELTKVRRGGLASAPIILHSFDFSLVEQMQHAQLWDDLADMLTHAARGLKSAGAEILLIATNTMHLLAERIEEGAGIEVLHIADATAAAISHAGYSRVLLLGTRFTMEKEFYRTRIEEKSGAAVVVPDEQDRDTVHRVIYDELCGGLISEPSRQAVSQIVNQAANSGAEATVLGCTELPLLITPRTVATPLLSTTEIHVQAAIQAALD